MKTYRIYILSIFCLLGFMACSDDDTSPALTKVLPSTIDNFPTNDYVLTEPEDGSNPLAFTATWTETLFLLDGSSNPVPAAPVSYTLQIDKAGNNFATPQVLAATTSLASNIHVADLNTLLIEKMGAKPEEQIEVELRLITSYGQNEAGESVSDNIVKLFITPYTPSGDLRPVYLIGNMNGWDNRNTDFMMFRNSSDPKDRVYTYTGRIEGGCYFKFIPEESLGSYKAYCRKDDGTMEYIDSEGGSFYNETDGYKKITIDVKEMTYTIEDVDMSTVPTWTMINFVGAFCGWGSGSPNPEPAMTPTAYDPHIWKINIYLDIIEYGVKFRANNSWDNRWCPGNPDASPYGTTDYNPTGHDNNISLAETGDYSVIFNDITGQYVIMKK